MGFEELAALKQQLSKRAQADKPPRSQAERPTRDAQASQGAQGRVQGTKPSAAPGAQSSKPRNASAAPAARSGATDGTARNRHRHGESGKPGNGGFAGRRPSAPATAENATATGTPSGVAAAPRKSAEQAQRGPRPPRPEKRVQPPVEPVVITIGQLQKRFPLAFPKNPAPKLPLKLGISKDLIAQAETLVLSEADLLEAIKVWCQGSRYWAAMTKGAARVNLEGQPEGIVTPEQAAHARSLAAASRRAKHGIVPKKKGEAAAPVAHAAGDAAVDADAVVAAPVAADVDTPAVSEATTQAAPSAAEPVATSATVPATDVTAAATEHAPSTDAHPEAVASALPVAESQQDAPEHASASEAAPSEQSAHSSHSAN